MEIKQKKTLWKPIHFDERWSEVSTSKLDNLMPSWKRKKEELLKDPKEYKSFVDRIKRAHAIETGVIEKLYDLREGITLTFIKEGFIEDLIQLGDTNISHRLLMDFLKDHLDAIEVVFDFVKSNRTLSISFIKEIHHFITRNQPSVEAIDHIGARVSIPLLKGEFKQLPNNPLREDGTLVEYAPPFVVASEMDNLLRIYNELESQSIHPIIIAAWFHHSFSIIHPFQDGNGRVARLMTSLILIKHDLFPFTVFREDKKRYIEALEDADAGSFQKLTNFFLSSQISNIESALNLTVTTKKSYKEVLEVLRSKIELIERAKLEKRKRLIDDNREKVFKTILSAINSVKIDLHRELETGLHLNIYEARPNSEKYYHYKFQIIEYAKANKYFFNSSLPRGWIAMNFILSNQKKYSLIFTLHHYGYDDSTMALGAFLNYIEKEDTEADRDEIISSVPFNIKPLTFSLEGEMNSLVNDIDEFISEAVTLTLAQISAAFG